MVEFEQVKQELQEKLNMAFPTRHYQVVDGNEWSGMCPSGKEFHKEDGSYVCFACRHIHIHPDALASWKNTNTEIIVRTLRINNHHLPYACKVCGNIKWAARPALYCGKSCKRKAYRQRKLAKAI